MKNDKKHDSVNPELGNPEHNFLNIDFDPPDKSNGHNIATYLSSVGEFLPTFHSGHLWV